MQTVNHWLQEIMNFMKMFRKQNGQACIMVVIFYIIVYSVSIWHLIRIKYYTIYYHLKKNAFLAFFLFILFQFQL